MDRDWFGDGLKLSRYFGGVDWMGWTIHQFGRAIDVMADEIDQERPVNGDHRANVEREMRRLYGGR